MADTGACMTPDQCFDEMAVALGVAEPKDTGYTELLDLVKGLKEENKKLKQDLHYYRCFVNAADPKCNMMNAMEKQDVDDYTDDPELAKHLYEMFHIEESDEEDSDEEEKKDHSGGWSPTSSPEPKQ